jgi:hypothetical protein
MRIELPFSSSTARSVRFRSGTAHRVTLLGIVLTIGTQLVAKIVANQRFTLPSRPGHSNKMAFAKHISIQSLSYLAEIRSNTSYRANHALCRPPRPSGKKRPVAAPVLQQQRRRHFLSCSSCSSTKFYRHKLVVSSSAIVYVYGAADHQMMAFISTVHSINSCCATTVKSWYGASCHWHGNTIPQPATLSTSDSVY